MPHSLNAAIRDDSFDERNSPIHSRPLRNRQDQTDLQIVTIKSPGVERNESNLDNVLRETNGSNNSDIKALRTAILSPGSTNDSLASPMLSDIRSPNLNRIKLDPLDQPSQRAHRRKVSSLQDRSKQLQAHMQPSGISSIDFAHPLDATARQNLIKMKSNLGEEDLPSSEVVGNVELPVPAQEDNKDN
jgi:hypothetical protein